MSDTRASDAERDAAAERLRHAAGDGRLTVDELDERLQVAYRASTRGELERLTVDVPATAPSEGLAAHTVAVVEGGGQERLLAIMGGVERSGHWKVARSCRVLTIMGGAEVDLKDADFAAEVVEMRVTSIMGGAEIRVPEGLNVEVSHTGIMGGCEIKLGEHKPSPGGPLLHLKVLAIMGGVEVVRGPRPPGLIERWANRTGAISP